ncbi:uncharacterized mitochondrial protein AtMg00860-like [Belonocnema kinseyi]|uniref:uncharacterized mitochondrial protein AtMg00860-like n=1 Tax=Belonocnema kinseyi TaxID=2817044 RepID=UPI00143DCB23|nr:uncharacterized mitochondrial protein AtMg00860-like [Belonocnema kinseyi]
MTKVDVVKRFLVPKNVHEVRQLLGLTGAFRRYIIRYALKAEPLTRLLKLYTKFQWIYEQKAFEDLRNALCKEPILALDNLKAETELHADASAEGLSAMLLQKDENDDMHIIYAVNKKSTEVEHNYH